jgi:hypothetical protein
MLDSRLKARGSFAGNPGLRERRPEVVWVAPAGRGRANLDELIVSVLAYEGRGKDR